MMRNNALKKNPMKNPIRKGIIDVWWRPHMVEGATFTNQDVPICPSTADAPPTQLILYSEAKTIYRRELQKDKYFSHPAYVCFYEDDVKFDSKNGIWFRSDNAFKVLKHFAGIVTPDFSTYQDFPKPLKLWNTYRMRAFGHWYGIICGRKVVNNVRWGTPETYGYCFDGIPKGSMVAIGTVGGSPKKQEDRERFEEGLEQMMRVVAPPTIIVYGSANYPCFEKIKTQGVEIISFKSKTAAAFEKVKKRRTDR